MTQEIKDLLTNGTAGTFPLTDVSLGGFLTSSKVSVTIGDINRQGANWTSSVMVNSDTATVAIGSNFAAGIKGDSVQTQGLTGRFDLKNQPLDQGSYSLSIGELDVTAGSLLTGTAHEVMIGYSPSAASGQRLAHVGSLVANLTPFANTSATLTNLDVFDNGFSLEDGSVSAGAFTIGKVLAVTNPNLTFAGVHYTAGAMPTGTVGLKVDSATLFPGNSTFAAEVDGFAGTYNLSTSALGLSATEAKLKVGKILDADATALSLSYDPAGSPQLAVSAGTATLTSELFPHVAGMVTNFAADSNGISFGNANLVSTPADQTIDIGGVIEASGLSVALSGFDYHANPTAGQKAYDGTVKVGAAYVSLFPGGSKPFSADVTGFGGSYDLNSQALALKATGLDVRVGPKSDPVAEVTATGLGFTLTPQTDGSEAVGVTIGGATAAFPKLGVSGAITDLGIDNTGFTIGSATLSATTTTTFGSVFSVQAPSVTVTNFGYTLGQTPTFVGSVSVSAAEIDLKLGGASGKATSVTGSLGFVPGDLGHFTFTADTVDVSLGSFLDLTATGIKVDTAPPPMTNLLDVDGKVTATFKASGASITGTAQHFGIDANGSLVEKDGFGVSLNVDDAGKLKWPTWLPIQVTYAAIAWPHFSANPSDFSIVLSASVNVPNLSKSGLEFSGFVQDAVIDVGLLENGSFPITSIKGAGIAVGGKIFGNTVKGSLFVATLETDSSGNPIPDGASTPVANSYLYGGIDGSIDIIGQGGFEIRLGISQFGLMDGFINVDQPRILDPDSGLAISNFHGSIHFASQLDSISDPKQLPLNKSAIPDSQQSLADWQTSLKGEVANVAKGISQGQSTLDALTSSIKIEAGATIYDAYATKDAFTLDADVVFDTTGKIEAVGTLTVGGGLSLHGGIYADFSSVKNGHVAILAYMVGPAQAPIVTAYGGIVFQYVGTPPPVAKFTEPNLGTGLALDGATTASANGIDLNGSSYTVEFWAKRADSGRNEYVIGQDGSTLGNGLQIGFDAQNQFFTSSNGQTLSDSKTDNAWHHWAVTFDKPTGTRTIYLDGISVATDATAPLTGSGTIFLVGRSGTTYFDGGVDEVRVWNVARAASEVAANFTQSVVPIDATLIADWNYNEGTGSTASDSSGNSHASTIHGNPAWAETTVFPPAPPAFNNFTITISGGADFSLPGLPGNLTVTGSVVFDVSPSQSSLDLTVNGTASIDPLGNLLTLDGKVHFDDANSQPKLYGVFEVGTGDLATLQKLGINVAGTAVLRFNTTGQDLSEPLLLTGQTMATTFTLPKDSVSLLINGSAGFMSGGQQWFTLAGELDAFFSFATDANKVTHPLLQIDFFGDLLVGDPNKPTFDLNSTGYFQIDDTGVAASIAATLVTSQALTSAGVDLRNNTFTLLLNTTPNDISYTIPSIPVPGKLPNPAAGTLVSIPNTPNGATAPTSYLQIHGSGDLVIKSLFDLNGSFDLLISPGLFSVGLDANFSLMVGSTTLESFHATGGLTINNQGLIAAVQATQNTPFTASYGFTINAAFLLEANTTGQPQTVGTLSLPAGNYAKVHGDGTLQLGSFVATGGFDFSYSTSSALMIQANATESLGPLGTVQVSGGLTILGGSDPGVYGAFSGSIATTAALPGIHLAAAAQLLVNSTQNARPVSAFIINANGTTNPVQTIEVVPGFQFQSGGVLTVAGLFGMSAAGEFDVKFDTSNIDIHAVATLSGFLGTQLGLNADIHILSADGQGTGGLVANASLSLGSSFGFGPVQISATPSLLVNTTSAARYGVPANTYQVELDNASLSVAGFQASGTLIVGVSNSVFSISVPSTNPVHVSFFGLGNVDVYGYINSNGQFSLNGSIGFDYEFLGTGVYGSISASLSNSSFSGSFTGTGKFAGKDVGSVGGSLVVQSNHVHLTVWLGSLKFDQDIGSLPMTAAASSLYWYSTPATAGEGDEVTLTAAATDSNGNPLPDSGYHWIVVHNGQTYAVSNGATFPLTLGDPGTYQAYLGAIDPGTSTILTRNSTIVVADVAPTVSSLNLQGAYASGVRQTFAPTVINHGTTGLTYAWSVTRNGASYSPADESSPSGGTFSFTPPAPNNSFNAPDTYAITLVVSDSFGGSTTTTGTLAVIDPTNVMVNTTLDDGSGISLRNAIAIELQLPQPYAIHFSSSLAGQTIFLSQVGDASDHGNSALAIPSYKSIILDAVNVPGITLSAASGPGKRLFYVAPAAALTLMNLTLTGGVASGSESQAEGGAIFSDGEITIESCTLIGNLAIGLAGANGPGLQADGQGGAVYQNLSASACYFWSLNSTYTNNFAIGANGTGQYDLLSNPSGYTYVPDLGGSGFGGAILNLASILLYNNTIANNTAYSGANAANAPAGGGVYEPANSIGHSLYNNILVGNVVHTYTGAPSPDDLDYAGSVSSFGSSNLINAPGAGVSPALILSRANPLLGPLADHGNGIKTYSLLPGSPALNAGNAGLTGGVPFDGRGLARINNGQVDIGAFEHQPYLVGNLNDGGPGSLRAAVVGDDDGSPIIFMPSLNSGTILLTTGPISISSNLSISGPGANLLTIDAGGASRIFTVAPGVTASLSGLTLSGGNNVHGGGVYNSGSVTIANSAFFNDTSVSDTNNVAEGGAIYNAQGAALTVTGTTFAHDSAVGAAGPIGMANGSGGAIFNAPGATLATTNDTFDSDSAQAGSAAAGRYGADGSILYNNVFNSFSSFFRPPTYVATTISGASFYTWDIVTSDNRALVNPNLPSSRIASTLYSATSFTVDVNVTDGKAHKVSFYLLDFDGNNARSERIDVIDPTNNGALLDSRAVSNFSAGQYLSWIVSGHVQFKFTNLNPNSNALVSGLFFDPAPAGATGPATFVGLDSTSQGNWQGTVGIAAGGAVENQGIAAISQSTFSNGSVAAYPASYATGAAIDNAAGATITLYNDLAANSTAGNDISNSGSSYGGHVLATTTTGVPAAILLPVGTGPALRSLANNGGPTPTIGLQVASTALAAGDAAAAASPLSSIPGLVGWWRGEGNAADSAGSATATLQGGVSFGTGEAGQAFRLNGSNASVAVPNAPALNAAAFSTGGWFNLSAAPASGSEFFLASKYGGNYNGWILRVNSALLPTISLLQSPTQYVNLTSAAPIALNTWVYLASTYDGTNLRLYVNGVQTASATLSGGYTPSPTGLSIGSASWASSSYTNGLIDEFTFFDRALAPAEVQTIAANSVPTTDQRGLARVVNGAVDVGSLEVQPYLVTNTNDAGPGSLRQAVLDDLSGDQPIVFASGLAKKTITLTSSPITIGHNLTISGLGANQLTISGGSAVEDFVVSSGNVTIAGLTIANGVAVQGGGIFNAGNLTLVNDALVNDAARNDPASSGGRIGQGGAIYDAPGASLTVTGSTFSGDSATGVSSTGVDGRGGAIANATGSILSATDDTFSGNSAQSRKGYGIDGYAIFGDQARYPSYAAVTLASNALSYTWTTSTTDPRALQKSAVAATDRLASVIYGNTSFTFDVNVTDGKAHQVSVYFLDWDSGNVRSAKIELINPANPSLVLDARTVSSYENGTYLSWIVSGHVTFRITPLAGNAVVAGLFFDPAPGAAIGAPTFVGTDTTTQGTWRGTTASAGFGGAIDNAGMATISNSTVAGNSVTTSGDGSGIENEPGAALKLFDTIVAKNSNGHDVASLGLVNGGTDLVTTSLGLPAGLVVSTADPLLGLLQNNGGPTQTMALGNGSPALNTGDPTNAPANDQRGMARIVGAGIDIGAFESIGGPPKADPGDGYVIHAGDPLTLSAGDSFDPAGVPLGFSWDINGDGTYGDATGVSPTLTSDRLIALGIQPRTAPYMVSVKVTNDDDTVTSTLIPLTVLPALHIASLSTGEATVTSTAIDSITATFSNPIDATTLDASVLSLTRDGAVVPINVQLQVQLIDGAPATYRVSGLSSLTQHDGAYVLTLDAGAISDSAGSGAGEASTSWVMDETSPTSRVLPLAGKQAGTSFAVSVDANDASSTGEPGSGVATIDLYVSTNDGPYVHWTTVPPGTPTAVFQGRQDTSYAFFSVARDVAGNQQIPTYNPTRTFVPDLTPPTTHVSSVSSTSPSFQVALTGTDTGGSGLAAISLYVQVDDGPSQLVATVAPNSSPVPYQGIVDGISHTYRFFSLGIDSAGNVETTPSAGNGDIVVHAAFDLPAPAPTGLVVQSGTTNHSYVRTVDLIFSGPAALDSLVSAGHIHLIKHDLNGKGATPISLNGVLHVVDHAIEFDFGVLGVGGNPNSFAGDGSYEIEVDGSAKTYSFVRLLGDVNGDGVVNDADLNLIKRSISSKHPNLHADANGDGKVNKADLALATKAFARSHKLKPAKKK